MPPVKMTRAEYEAKYGSAPVVSSSTLDITPTPIRMTRAEYNEKYRPQPKTFGQDFSQDIAETGVAQQQALQTGVERSAAIDERVASGETSQAKGLFQKFGSGLGTAANVLFQTALGGAKAVLPQSVETRISKTIGADLAQLTAPETRAAFVNKLKESDGGILMDGSLDKKAGIFLEEVGTAYRTDPNFQADVQAAGGILEWLALPGTARTALVKTADIAQDVIEDAGTIARRATDNFSVSRNDTRVQNVVNELEAIENKYAPTRRKADIDPQVNESRTRIAQSNVLNNAVDEDGLIRTKTPGGAVDTYRAQTIDGVEDVVRKNLEVEGSKVNLNELRADMYDAVTKSGLEGADLARAIKGIDAELKGLSLRADTFGDVLLSKIQDAKTSIYKHIDYTKPSGVTYRKSLARVYKETIENKSKLPVKEWNAELAKYYKDLDRLADLDGKRVKGGRLGKYTANIAGSAVGGVAGATAGAPGALVGGMLGGELAGFIQGKAMAGTFRKGVRGDVPENQLLADAKARAESGARDLRTPDAQVGAPREILNDPNLPENVKTQITKVEGQIKDNIKQQNAAIKAGDFTLVAALKDVYQVLVSRLTEIIEDYKKNGVPLGMSIRKTVTPESVAKKADKDDIKFLAAVIDDVKAAKADPEANKILDAMGLGKATDDELVSFAKEVLDETDIAKNLEVKATPQTTALLEETRIELQLNNLDPKNFNTVNEFVSAYNKKPVLKSNIDLQKLNDTETKTVGDVLRGELKNKYKNVADVRIETVTPGSFYDADLAKNVKGQIVLLDNDELVILMRSDIPVSKMREILLEEVDHAATYKRNPEFITRDAVVANKGTSQEYIKLPSERAARANVEKRLLESRYTKQELEDIWKQANGKTGSTALLEEAKGKTLEEFANNEYIKVYHGTNEQFENFDLTKGNQPVVWFTDNPNTIANSGARGTKRVMERYIKKEDFPGWDEYDNWGLSAGEKSGVIKLQNTDDAYFAVTNTDKIKTFDELKKIWESAN